MAARTFKQRLRAGERLIGTFLKTPAPIVCEVLGLSELDAVCLDAEHAPFDRLALGHCVHALQGAGKASLIRVAAANPEYIMQALDCGATGVLVPHVASPEQAAAAVKAATYCEGGRGYAGSTRAGAYGTRTMAAHLRNSAEQVTVVVQIEDPAGVQVVDKIAAVPGIDCLFIGRIDLTVAYGVDSPNDEKVLNALRTICAAGKKAGVPVGMFAPDVLEAKQWAAAGASLFLLGSDQGFILQGANELARTMKEK